MTPNLLVPGSIISMPDGYRAVLADAAIIGRELWWHEAFGREHFITFDSLTEADGWLHVLRDGDLVAAVGGREGADDDRTWSTWEDFLKTAEGQSAAQAIADMKTAAANWK